MRNCKYIVLTLLLALALSKTAAAKEGAVALAVKDVLSLPELSVTSTAYGGKLLLSDSPETVTQDGITYQDTVSGDVRLFFHHVNATKEKKKIVVVLENKNDRPAAVTVYQHGLGGPGLDYLAVGKEAQARYMDGGDIYLVEVPANGSALLDTRLNDAAVLPDMLVNGIYDFKADLPVTVKVLMMPDNANPRKFAAEAKILPADEHRLRGTFDGKDRMLIPNKVYDPVKDGAVAITLGDNLIDRYVEGIDATDGSKVFNYGNYGIVYRLFLPSGYGRKVSYWLNPRGGDYAGVLGVKYRHVRQSPVYTPSDRVAFGSAKLTDFARIGQFEGGQSLWLTFSPPGASNLPVKIVIDSEE